MEIKRMDDETSNDENWLEIFDKFDFILYLSFDKRKINYTMNYTNIAFESFELEAWIKPVLRFH